MGTLSWTFDMLAGVSRYDFRTLKMAKSEIFWNLLGSLWKGPWWLLLIEKLLKWLVLMFWRVLPSFWFICRPLFLALFISYAYAWRFWDFGLKTLRWKFGAGGIRSGVAWEIEISCFGLNCGQVMSWTHAKEFEPFIWTFDILAGVSRYDFRTLKMTKSEIFWNLVGSLWKGPRWFCLK